MRGSTAIAGAAALVAALLLGAWFLFGDRESPAAEPGSPPGPAPTTNLEFPPVSSGLPSGSRAADPYPIVPSDQVRAETDGLTLELRTGDGGRQLLVPAFDLACLREEVWFLGEHPDRVEVEIRSIAKPPPPGVSVRPDGSYDCGITMYSLPPHAVISLRSPLGTRTVVVTRKPSS
jgi:hypothetical protein